MPSGLPSGPEDFAHLKETLCRVQNELQSGQSPDEVLAWLERDAGRQLSDKQREAMTSGVRFPVHRETDRILALSGVRQEDDGTTVTTTAITMFIDDTTLVLKVSGGKGNLDWSRRVADQWADAILAANAR